MNKDYRVGIIGCGMILERHIEAINCNENYRLMAVCDINPAKLDKTKDLEGVGFYTDYKEMIAQEDINFVVVATPNNLHYEQAIYCLKHGCDVLVEKPAVLDPSHLTEMEKIASENKRQVYGVLQVRLNPVVQKIKSLLTSGVLGEVRGVSLVQRWQRPKEYFDGWRGEPKAGGGILHECGIHYLDVLCYLCGTPSAHSTKHYNTKHVNVGIEDTIYSILDFGKFGGTVEVTIASEPKNIECSISILTDKGYVKIGGKALSAIEEFKFLDESGELNYERVTSEISEVRDPNAYTSYQGSCPNHPDLYAKIDRFHLKETHGAVGLIDEIYKLAGLNYY